MPMPHFTHMHFLEITNLSIQNRIDSQLCEKQFAYRKNKSCHSALEILTDDIYTAIDKPKTKVGAIFIDFFKSIRLN